MEIGIEREYVDGRAKHVHHIVLSHDL
jgi:hypothetical protein